MIAKLAECFDGTGFDRSTYIIIKFKFRYIDVFMADTKQIAQFLNVCQLILFWGNHNF